jgi:DNA repair protein RadD
MPPCLRPYQEDCIARLRQSYGSGHRAPLLALPTGGGKTLIFAHVTAGARAKARRVLIAVHRRELIHQASAKLDWAGVPHGTIAAGFDPNPTELVQLASVQTLARREDHRTRPFDLLVFGEAHHSRAETWQKLLAAQPAAKRLGVTATPARLDGKGLGIAAGGCFDDLVIGPSTATLIRDGYLCPVRCFAPAKRLDLTGVRVVAGDYVREELAFVVNTGAITADCIAEYRQRADHQPCLVFCCTVAHAVAVAAAFGAAGYRSHCVDGETPKAERDALITGLATGHVEVLTSCALIDEGLDVPAVGCVILLRPTKSLVLHRQQIGRGMRVAEAKAALIVLDHVGNVITHGLPETEPRWSLAGVEKKPGDAPVWTCPDCGAVNPIGRRICACGYEKPTPTPRDLPDAIPGELAELTPERLARARRMSYGTMMRTRLSEAELRAFARARGYKRGWVLHRLREQWGTMP